MDNKYKWNLKDIYESEEDLEKAKSKIYNLLNKIEQYKGILAKDANNIYECYKIYENIYY